MLNKYITKRLFCTKITTIYPNLLNFKTILAKLLEEKIYHYSILNNDTKELINLKNLTQNHIDELNIFNKTQDSFLNEKASILNNSTVLLEYKAFIEFIKYIHEKKEEDINNYLRDKVKNNEYTDKLLIRIRDEWRDCLLPDILDSQAKPINTISIVSQVGAEFNKYLANLII
jgi:hypothetical protein